MKNRAQNNYVKWGLTALLVIIASITFFFTMFRFSTLAQAVNKVVSSLMPFVYGFVMAYLLMPVFNFLEKRLTALLVKRGVPKGKAYQRSKLLSSILCVVFGLGLVGGLLSLLLPQLIVSVMNLAGNMNTYLNTISDWITGFFHNNPIMEQNADRLYQQASEYITNWVADFMLPQMVNLMTGLVSTVSVLADLVIGIIIMIYVLNSKDLFSAQCKKLLYSLVPIERANIVLHNVRFTHRVFSGFISGKMLDSLIIGIITAIVLGILEMPYALLISVIIGVTNFIPFFGPFLGAIPSALLILIEDPIKAIYFVIFILILQQFDGNILGPKILGDSTGLSSFWVMFAILLSGGLFGFVGMVLGVPLMAVLYSLLAGLVNRQLRDKKLPDNTSAYYHLESIDPETRAPHIVADGQENRKKEKKGIKLFRGNKEESAAEEEEQE